MSGLLLAGALAVGTAEVRADVVIVESRTGGLNFSAYSDTAGTVSLNGWQNSTGKSTAEGLTAGIGSRFNTNAGIGGDDVWFQVAPVLGVSGGEYRVEVTHTPGNAGTTVLAGLIVTGGTGLPGTTDVFNAAVGNAWELVGTLKLDPGVTTPTVRFTERDNNNRFFADAVRFTLVPEPASLTGVALAGLALVGRRRRK